MKPALLILFANLFCFYAFSQDYADTSEYAHYYIVSLDHGQDYNALKRSEEKAGKLTGLKTDELGRSFKKGKGVVLPDICEDDMYCGEYYPRRPFYEDNFLSIEMRYAYEDLKSDDLEMLLMAGMFTEEQKAKDLLEGVKKKFPRARYFRSKIYLGCMH